MDYNVFRHKILAVKSLPQISGCGPVSIDPNFCGSTVILSVFKKEDHLWFLCYKNISHGPTISQRIPVHWLYIVILLNIEVMSLLLR